jgi:Zn-dependent metalloprotease
MVCMGAAVLAVGLSLIVLSAIALVAGVGDAAAPATLSGHAVRVAVQDGAVAFYLAQLVSISFFTHTAGLRFAALPGLLLVGLALATTTAATARVTRGSARERMLLATSIAVPYALLSGLGAFYLPLHFTASGIGSEVAVLPSTVEAFVLPLAWGLLFAPLGGLVGVFGANWRRETARLLGPWATPLWCSLRALVMGLALSALGVLVGGTVLIGRSGDARSLLGGGFSHAVTSIAAALIALPTLVISLFLACFGVSFDWRVEALDSTQGSGSILGGTLPSTGAGAHHGAPAVLALLLALATGTVLAAGWLTARRSGKDVRLSIANALRTGTLLTLICWLFALLARVDAQAGGLLGLHFEADVTSLLWRVPVWCLLGSLTGIVAYLATRGTASRRQLATALLAVARPSGGPRPRRDRSEPRRQGLATRAALGLGCLSLPAILIGIGSAGATTATTPAPVSLAPISRAAEQRLRGAAVPGSRLSVAVDPNTRVADAAIVDIPLTALGVSPSQTPVLKAKAVLAHYGNLFGMSGGLNELGTPKVVTDPITKTSSHVSFPQVVDGTPVFGGGIGVDLSADGKNVEFVNGSFIPEVTLADKRATLDGARALALAKEALPNGKLVHPPRLEIYAGATSHPFGPTARLAWFVWLTAGPNNASNEYVVDAATGSILHIFVKSFNATTPEPNVEIYTAQNKVKELPGKLVVKDPEVYKGTDADVKAAYRYIEGAYRYFYSLSREPKWTGYNGKNHGNGENGRGEKPEAATVHYGIEYKKAEWDGAAYEIVFGDGFPKAVDIVGHEYSDAITEYTADEADEGESGAIAEGWADAMGQGLESYEKAQHKEKSIEPTWEFGKEAPGGPFRDLKQPKRHSEITVEGKSYPDPEKLSEYVNTCLDSHGIHENSTIISHAFYLLAQKTNVETAAKIFFLAQTHYLGLGRARPFATFEQFRDAAVVAANRQSAEIGEDAVKAFKEVGLNGLEPTPVTSAVGCKAECSFQDALQAQEPAHGTAATVSMLATLYRARGVLAQPSAAGRHFLPLYEENMGRITELVSRDPGLQEMVVNGLQQTAPALDGLAEGQGQKHKLSASEMAQIEAALKRLAQDDRLISGGGTLAKLIEHELAWLHLGSYAGMTYAKGFARLNAEVKPLTAITLVDPNCSGTPYHNEFGVNAFTIDTPGHHQPGEVAQIVASGIACGAAVEEGAGTTCYDKAGALNEKLSLELPPGDEIDPTKGMESGLYIGKISGRVIACAGEHSRVVYGVTGITSLKNWVSTECPEAAIACYEVKSTFEEGSIHGEGHGYGWVTKEGEHLVFTTGGVNDKVEEKITKEHLENVPVSFGQFAVELCARAGKAGGGTCGTGTSAPWVHKNGSESQPGCPTKYGRYFAHVTNSAKEMSVAVEHCVYWGEGLHTQAIDGKNSVNAVSCVPESTDCVVTDSNGNALYSTNVSATAAATWNSWTGPTGASPGEAIACPSSSLCALGAGKATEGGGNMYYATSLGGGWKEAFKPAHGVLAVSCPSESFCVDGQESGRIRYSSKPASSEWTEVTGIGSSAINGLSCLSSSFCAAVNGSGDLYVANTEAHVKEASGWKMTDIDGSTALHGVACTSTTSCVAVDGAGDVIDLTINGSGEAKEPAKHDIDNANDLTAISCAGEFTCAAVDSSGDIFASSNAGATWSKQYALGTKLTSVSCASGALCVAADTSGNATAFIPAVVPPSYTQKIDSSNKVNAVSCVPLAPECVVADSTGKALYATAVSATVTSPVTWTSWSGPTGASPSEAIACPTSSLCTLADGLAEPGSTGGNMYYATSLGGAWTEAFSPGYGVVAISCPTSSFCVDGQEGEGFIRYSTKPASSEWTSLSIGLGAINAVDCLSASFCAAVDSTGHVHVANTEAKIKEEAGWKSTAIEGSPALNGIACAATTSCVAIAATGVVFDLTLNSSGEATATKEDIDGTNKLTAITCTEGLTCVTVDSTGNVFASDNGGETWRNEQALGTNLTSVSCSGSPLCVAGDTTGEVTAFEPE